MTKRNVAMVLVVLAGLAVGVACSSSNEAKDVTVGDAAQDLKQDGTLDVRTDTAPQPDVESDVKVPDGTLPGDTTDVQTGFDYRTPWDAPKLAWTACEEVALEQTLAQKAAYYDWIAPKLHQVVTSFDDQKPYSLVYNVRCTTAIPETIVPDSELPKECTHDLAENSGLWTSLYLASQAFRYATTKEAEALTQVRTVLRGMFYMMEITGKEGLYTRDFRNPELPGMFCPGTNDEYSPPSDKMVGNKWVKVDTDGCFITWDPTANGGAGDWKKDTEHCTDAKYAGFCWQRNASKDEYSGHVFALGVVAKLVDDPECTEMAKSLLTRIGRHLVKYNYWINDYDGRNTRYGSASAMAMDEFPGYNALLALTWTLVAAAVTGEPDLVSAYHDCLLQESGELACIKQGVELPKDYRTYLNAMALALGCSTNYDNVSMAMLSYLNLMWLEDDPANIALYRKEMEKETKGPDKEGRDIWAQKDPFYNFILAAMMGADPEKPDEALRLVDEGLCSMRAFPSSNVRHARDNSALEVWCTSERHGPLAKDPVPVELRCSTVFEWWNDPNEIEVCAENLLEADPPAGYLLPYWMGRYFGFIPAEM